MSNKYKQAYRKILEAENILLVSHHDPDGDTVSSAGAIAEILKQENKNYLLFCQDKPADNLNFLPNAQDIINDKNLLEKNFSIFDLIITLDCGSLSKTGLTELLLNRKKNQFLIEFDHHVKMDNYSDLEIRIDSAASTTEVLYYFFKENNLIINKEVANCLLTGILTDTGNFLNQATSKEAIKIASEMLVYGANFSRITKNTFQNKTLDSMKTWGLAFKNLKINKKYNIAFSVLSSHETEKAKTLDGVANFLSNLYGVKAILLLKQETDMTIKGSLRSSHPGVDVSKLALALGGGGHPKASGFLTNGQIEICNNGWRIK